MPFGVAHSASRTSIAVSQNRLVEIFPSAAPIARTIHKAVPASFLHAVDAQRSDADSAGDIDVLFAGNLIPRMGVVEAMVCGTAVVATEVGGIPEIGARTGGVTLVPPDNPAALADAIVTLLDDPVRRETSATNARANARRAFGPETIRDQYIDAYRVAVGMDGTMTPG